MRYQKTLAISKVSDLIHVKPGQWVDVQGMRGQYLGYGTRTGQYFFRLQGPKKWGSREDCMANHYMRLAAQSAGAK